MTEIASPQPPKHDIGAYVSEAFALFMKEPVKWLVIGFLGQLALGVGYWGGFQYCAMKQLRGETLEFGDVFYPFKDFGRMFIPSLILGLMVTVGLLLCVLPGIVVGVLFGTWWFFLWPLMLRHGNLTWQQARDLSKETASKDFMGTLIINVVAGFIGGLGGMVGLAFLTAGLTGIIQVIAFQRTFGPDATGGGAWGGPGGALPAPQGAPAPDAGWGAAPQPPMAPQQAAPGADPNAGWGAAPQQPMAPQQAAPQNAGWGAPAAPAAPAADPNAGWGAPAQPAAPAPTATPAASADGGNETGVQSSTSNPDEAFTGGRTMAMSAVDFEKMLKGGGSDNKG